MNGTLAFTFVFSVIMSFSLIMMLVALQLTKVVKAGDIHEFTWRYNQSKGKPRVIKDGVNGLVSTKDMHMFQVKGDSMQDYHIHTGNRVLVEKIDDEQKPLITDNPVIVFSIDTNNCFDGKYKLRKFIGYVDDLQNPSWENLYDKHSQRIKISKEDFVRECTDSVSKMKAKKLKERHVLSETYNTDLQKYKYSLHRESAIFGRVKYVLA